MKSKEEFLPDDGLPEAAAEGDESAAATLYYRYADPVYRVCRRMIPDSQAAKDCAQETWIKIFKNIHRYQSGTSFRAWAVTIAVHSAIDHCRKHSSHRMMDIRDHENHESFVQPLTPRSQMEEAELRQRVDQALRTLSLPQRTAFVLRHYEGLSLAEIAEVMNCSEGSVKTHVHRAVLALRQILAPGWEDDHERKSSEF